MMREERLLSFHSVPQAIAAEQALLAANIAAKAMPTPAAAEGGCAMCLRVAPDSLPKARAALAARGIPLHAAYCLGALERRFSRALGIGRGELTAIVGCGGKTGLMERLCDENRAERVLMSTTTRIFRPSPERFDFEGNGEADAPRGITLAYGARGEAMPGQREKLTGLTPEELCGRMRSFDYGFVECDGSRGKPLKGWAEHEPVVPACAALTVGVVTLGAVGQPVGEETVHRMDRFCALTGASLGEPVSLRHLAAMICGTKGLFARARGRRALFINRVERPGDEQAVWALLALLGKDFLRTLDTVCYGSLKENICTRVEEQA